MLPPVLSKLCITFLNCVPLDFQEKIAVEKLTEKSAPKVHFYNTLKRIETKNNLGGIAGTFFKNP